MWKSALLRRLHGAGEEMGSISSGWVSKRGKKAKFGRLRGAKLDLLFLILKMYFNSFAKFN